MEEEPFIKELLHALNAQSQILFLLMAMLLILIIVLIVSQIIQLLSTKHIFKVQAEQFNKTLDIIKTLPNLLPPPNSSRDKLVVNMPGMLPTDTEQGKQEILDLADKCVEIGEKIDAHTDRRNNSKLISELVYKISTRLNLDNETCTLYFCAAMVYDIGFLDVPEEYFRAEILNTSERKILKAHVKRGKDHLNFVSDRHRIYFEEACTYHHENQDGTGYPEGLVGDKIPLIARIIHVVESYNSLVNPRSYHKILDKTSAISDLRRQTGRYDTEIIEILASII